MQRGCKIDKQDGIYFMTFTIVDWLYALKPAKHKKIICDSLNYCAEKKGLRIYCYVIMDTHMHLIATALNNNLSSVIRDFKSFTAEKIIDSYLMESTAHSKDMLNRFAHFANKHSRNKKYQVWQQYNHPEEVYSNKFTLSKIFYMHNNPVDAGMVDKAWEYAYSSAIDYVGGKGPVIVEAIHLHSLMN
jgi:REP element-mobilizing transposase RayT